jgi:polysaccharide biosynthesis transport protein
MAREFQPTSSEESIAVRAFGIIRRRAVVATVAFATIMGAAIAFAVYLPDLYTANAIVMIERPLPDGVVRPTVNNELEGRLYQIKAEVLSRERLTALVKRFNLYPELRKKASFEEVLNQAREDIDWEANGPEQVSGRAKTVAFTLTYTGNDRKTVADVTNAVAQFYVEHNSEMRAGEARRAVELLQDQVRDARRQVDGIDARVRSFATEHSAQLPQSASIAFANFTQITEDLRQNINAQDKLRDAMEKLQEGLAEANELASAAKGVIAEDGQAVPLSKELTKLQSDLADAKKAIAELQRQGLTAAHPDVDAATRQIAALEKQVEEQRQRDVAAFKAKQDIDKERVAVSGAPKDLSALPASKRSMADLQKELDKLQRDEKDLRDQRATLTQRFDASPTLANEFQQLQSEYRSAKENYDVLERRLSDAKLSESIENTNQGESFRILDAAVPPEGPSAPNRLRLVIMGLLLALAAGGAGVIAAEQFDTSFHSVDDLREFTAVPIIATIPQIGGKTPRGWLRVAFGTVGAVAAVVLVATLSAYIANGNDTLVRLLQRAG